MKKIFFIFIFSVLSFSLGALVFAQNLDDYPAPTPNTPNNDQALRNLVGDAYVDSCAVAESTATIDPVTGESNNNANTTCKDNTSDGIYFSPNVSIPGFAAVGQKVKITPDSIALYINAIYKYGAGFAGLVAIFMIVFAAWQWIMAAGNSGKIDNAKDTIIASLVGLALLFGGYLLLNQISTRLVNLKSLKITPIPTKLFERDQASQGARSDRCTSFDQIKCNEMAELGLCDWIVVPNGASSCLEKQGGQLASWEAISQIYAQGQKERLICCGKDYNVLADDWEIGFIGGTNQNCSSVFNGDADRLYNFNINSCLSLKCEEHNWSQSNCEAMSFCYWYNDIVFNDCRIKP